MFALLRLIQSIIKTLHPAGTPGRVDPGTGSGSLVFVRAKSSGSMRWRTVWRKNV
jgi:hypothetical protein